VKFSEACDLLPDSLKIEGVENRSPDVVLGGTFGDIYTAQYRGTPVALKRLRFFQAETVETRRVLGSRKFEDDLSNCFFVLRNSIERRLYGRTSTMTSFYHSLVLTSAVSRDIYAWFRRG
jgi:hypothetical protein